MDAATQFKFEMDDWIAERMASRNEAAPLLQTVVERLLRVPVRVLGRVLDSAGEHVRNNGAETV
jgi:hypothetical protein